MAYEGEYINEELSFNSDGGSDIISLSVDSEDIGTGWDYETYGENWVSISFKNRYSTNTTATVNVSANSTSEVRYATVGLMFNGANVGEISIEQDAASSSGGGNTGGTTSGSTGGGSNTGSTPVIRETDVVDSSLTVGKTKGSRASTTLIANYNCVWDCDMSAVNWLDVSISDTDSYNETLTVTVTETNPTIGTRTAKVYVIDEDGIEHVITVTQEAGDKWADAKPLLFNVGSNGGTLTTNLTANYACNWEIDDNLSWVSYRLTGNPSTSATLTMTVSANPNVGQRETGEDEKITITNDLGETYQPHIIQDGVAQTYDVNPKTLSFNANGGSKTITLTSNGYANYTVSSYPEWCDVNCDDSGENVSVPVIAEENKTTSKRSGTITFKVNGTNKTLSVSVSQEAGEIKTSNVDPKSITLGKNGGSTGTINLISSYNCDWRLEDYEAEWLDANITTNGVKEGKLSLRTKSGNGTFIEREVVLTVYDAYDNDFNITVKQAASEPYSNVIYPQDYDIFKYDEVQTVYTFELKSNWNASWNRVVSDNWINAEIVEGGNSNLKLLKLSVDKNDSVGERRGTVTLTNAYYNGADAFVIEVVQEGGGYTYDVEPTLLEFDCSGGSKTFRVTSNGLMDLQRVDSNSNISTTFSTKNATAITVTVKIDATTQYGNEVYSVELKNKNDDTSHGFGVNVIQSGVPGATKVEPSKIELDTKSGSTGEIRLTSNYDCEWRCETEIEWIEPLEERYYGNTTVTVKAISSNGALEDRSGVITFTDDADEPNIFTVTVTQKKTEPWSNVRPEPREFSCKYEGGETTFELVSNWNANWNVNWSSKPNWISVEIESFNGTNANNRTLYITVNENPEVGERTGVVTVYNTYDSFDITITQEGGGYVYDVEPTLLEFDCSGDTENNKVGITSNGLMDLSVTEKSEWVDEVSFSDVNASAITVTTTVLNNEDYGNRVGSVKLKNLNDDSSHGLEYTIIQSGVPGATSVSPSEIKLGKNKGDTAIITLTSNYDCEWRCEYDCEYIEPLDERYYGNTTITVTAKNDNGSIFERPYGTITITDDNDNSWTVSVTQKGDEPYSYIVYPQNYDIFKYDEVQTVYTFELHANWWVQGKETWYKSVSDSWIIAEIEPFNGTNANNRKMTIRVTENSDAKERRGTVTLTNEYYYDENAFVIEVIQEGDTPKFSINPNSLVFESSSGQRTTYFISNNYPCYCDVVSNAYSDWCTVSFDENDAGNDKVRIYVSVIKNEGGERSGIIEITPYKNVQDKGNEKYKLFVSQKSSINNGGGEEGGGNGDIITNWTNIKPLSFNFGYEGKNNNIVELSSSKNCNWTIQNNASWINITKQPENGLTATTLTFNCLENNGNGNGNRNTTIKVGNSINGSYENIIINQGIVNPYIYPTGATVNMDNGTVSTICNGKSTDNWSMYNKPNWVNDVSFENNGKSKEVKCNISYDENKTTSTREGNIIIKRNNNDTFTFKLTQNGISLIDRKTWIDKDELIFTYEGGEDIINLGSNYNAVWTKTSSNEDWFKSSINGDKLIVKVSENKNAYDKNAVIYIKADNGDTYGIKLGQNYNNGKLFSAFPNLVTIQPEGGEYLVKLTCSSAVDKNRLFKTNWGKPIDESDNTYEYDIIDNGSENAKLKIIAKPNESGEIITVTGLTVTAQVIDENDVKKTRSLNDNVNIDLFQDKLDKTLNVRRERTTFKLKSDYSIKKKHALTSQGDIYESDFMTISPMDELFSTQIPVHSSNGFKFTIRETINMQRKHSRGKWLEHSDCGNGNNEVWTSDCLTYDFITPETKIKLKPNYNSIKDFAYYGSAVDLINATINNVIMYFPAELYFSEKVKTIDGKKYYIIDNDFDIDIHTVNVRENDVINPMRYFTLNYFNYNLIGNNGNETAIDAWSSNGINNITCNDLSKGIIISKVILTIGGKEYNLYVYQKDDKILWLYDNVNLNKLSIRPNKQVVEKYFNNIDEFEGILVNRNTKPLYKATFDSPFETEYGIKSRKVDYVWPNRNNWNPVLKSSSYDMYLGSLIKVASFHDEYDSNNIWRSMTHEAIKNLDWTFIRKNGDTIEDMSTIDNSRIDIITKLYGRQYDDIKRYIDNIKNVNSITYDEKNNLPDYNLSDACDLNGWEIYNLNVSDDNALRTPSLYSGVVNGYNTTDANTTFLRRLKINSKYILSKKGTRSGIEIILGLFGFDESEYNIKEYICVAKGKENGYDRFTGGDKNDKIKYPLAEDIKVINNGRNDSLFNQINTNPYYKLPVREITLMSGGTDVSYIVPWFTKGLKYDNDLYFQMFGGWGKQEEKTIDLDITNVKTIISDEDNGFTLYDETESYLKFARALDDMLSMTNLIVKTGDICYVTDITDIMENYNFKDESEKNNVNDFSHYFILENDNLSSYLGYHKNDDKYGWKNILSPEIESGNTENGKKVIYLESLIDDTKGNNPHVGKGGYDNGNQYLSGMTDIFEYAYDNDLFKYYSDAQCEKIKNYKFELMKVIDENGNEDHYINDNQKSWYFTDNYYKHENNVKGYNEAVEFDLHEMKPENGKYVKVKNESIILNVGNGIYNPYNPEGGNSNDEAAANSIINTKKMVIEFKPKNGKTFKDKTKLFIKNRVLPYVKQMIPSTTIFEYKIDVKSEKSPMQ